MRYVAGIDLGGSSVKVVAVTPAGQALIRLTEGFDPERPLHFAETIRALHQRLATDLGGPPERTGLSAPGLAAADGASIAYMPGRLRGLEGLVWSEYLATPMPVPVLNDAHAALLGEVWLGAARTCRQVLLLTLGTGVGGAAMVDGRLLKGAIGRAGHFGHLCLDPAGPPDVCDTPGSLEYQVGNAHLPERSKGRFTSTHELVERSAAGDPEAREIWLKSVRALACGIASLINVLDPETIIVGGGIARAGPALFAPLAEALDAVEWRPGGHRVRIVPALLGESAGAFGAAYQTMREA